MLLPAPSQLLIARYGNDSSYYLFYLDADGNEMTDTCHESVERAMEQAAFEFRVRPDEWDVAEEN